MVCQELEFRGINMDHLKMYIEELGGKPVTGHIPITFQGHKWTVEILKETEIEFTPVFKVNSVLLRFSAATKDDLENLIRSYRYKTTRVGG